MKRLLLNPLSKSAQAAVALALALFSGVEVAGEPITVTSGQFSVYDDAPAYFQLSGAGGFELSGFGPHIPNSPVFRCLSGCALGSELSLSTTAGGFSDITPFTLGMARGAIVNGTVFWPPGSTAADAPLLAGTLRFDAPAVLLPEEAPFGLSLSVPFVLTGEVSGFARDDEEARAPLFTVSLTGHGTATLLLVGETLFEPELTYEFAPTADPVPEPASMLLLGTGLAGMAVRHRRRRRSR